MNIRARTSLLAVGTLALVVSACGQDPLSRVADQMAAAQSPRPFTMPSGTLTAHTGEPFDLRAGTVGRFALVFFGYTYCPDTCPMQMAAANEAISLLSDEERDRVVELFVSVDPARDSVARIASWLGGMHSPAIGLRGPSEQLDEIMGSMGLAMPPMSMWQHVEGGGPNDYIVPHPASLFLVTPDGMGRFQYPQSSVTPKQIADDLRLLMTLPWDTEGEHRGSKAGD